MADANRDEVEKCKRIATAAFQDGDTEKAIRFLHKAKRMSPEDKRLDALLAQMENGCMGEGMASDDRRRTSNPKYQPGDGVRHRPSSPVSPDKSSVGAGAERQRVNKSGENYTAEQMSEVQRILRTRDYYDILKLPKDAGDEDVKKAYRKTALKLHPDKNRAPGAEEAFKKVSKAVQCLTDRDKKKLYDQYGDEEHIPHQQRHHYQQDFVSPEDLFAAFFGGGTFQTFPGHQHRQHHQDPGGDGAQRAHLLQMLPVIVLVLLTLASNFASRDTGSRFSFSASGQYQQERTTASIGVTYYVANDFEDRYPDGTRVLGEFERQVEVYYVRNLHSECDYQEKVMYKKVMIAKRRNNQEELTKARNHPRPACKEIDRIKKRRNDIYRQATIYMPY